MTTPHRCSICRSGAVRSVLTTKPEAVPVDDPGSGYFETVELLIGVCADCLGRMLAGTDLEVMENVWPD